MLQRLLFGLLVAAVTFFLLDLAVGAVLITPLSPRVVSDSVKHHRLVPGAASEFRHPSGEYAYRQAVNALGFRGRELSVRKEPGAVRIALLGDSFTMGKGVPDDSTFAVRLERLLSRHAPACEAPRIEVINGGVDSYAPILSALQLQSSVVPLKPDIVVEFLDMSDLVQEGVYRQLARRNESGEIVAVRGESPRWSESLRNWATRRLFFTRALLFYVGGWLHRRDATVRTLVTQANDETLAHTLASDTADRTAQWAAVFESLASMRAASSRAGAAFMLAVYPWAHQVTQSQWRAGRRVFMSPDARPSTKSFDHIKTWAVRENIPVIDLVPAFADGVRTHQLFFDHDMHFTAPGHALVAEELTVALRERFRPLLCGASAR